MSAYIIQRFSWHPIPDRKYLYLMQKKPDHLDQTLELQQ